MINLDEDLGSLTVLNAEAQLAGMLTSTNFVTVVPSAQHPSAATVGDYMTEDILTVSSAATLHDGAVKIIREDIQHFLVTGSGDKIAGKLSATDIPLQLLYMGSSGTD